MKGFMQVVVTHSRRPLAALRALGPLRFFAAVATSLGTVATALGYPLFMIVSIVVFYDGSWLTASTPMEALRSAVGVTLFGAGLVAMIARRSSPSSGGAGADSTRWFRSCRSTTP